MIYKSKESIRYVVVRPKYVIHPNNSWTSQNFPKSNASPLAKYFSRCWGYWLLFFLFLFFLNFLCWQKILVCFFLYWCFYPLWLRDWVSPVCNFFKFFIWNGSWSYFIVMLQFAKKIVLTFLHTFVSRWGIIIWDGS